MACAAEKQSVTLTRMPSEVSCRVAFSPSGVSGHLTTTFLAMPAYSRPSRSIPSVSRLVTSAETSPSTISQMAATCARKSTPPSLATSEGFVVTPSTKPSAAPSRISSRFAVSRKNFITSLLPSGLLALKSTPLNSQAPYGLTCPALLIILSFPRRNQDRKRVLSSVKCGRLGIGRRAHAGRRLFLYATLQAISTLNIHKLFSCCMLRQSCV